MHWNRFDICDAYCIYARHDESGHTQNALKILDQLRRMIYTPSLWVLDGEISARNAQRILEFLRARHGKNIRPIEKED